MLYSVQSKPNDYSTVSMNIDIPWKCTYVKYYVSSINTKANILMTTDDDYLLFDDDIKIEFQEMYNYSLNYLVNMFNTCQTLIVFKVKDNRTLTMTSQKDIVFKGGSHRAKIITGFYNTKDNEFIIKAGVETEVPDLPILDFGNKFYLVSLQGNATYSSIGQQEYTPSVIANIDTMFLDNEALIVNYDLSKPVKIKCNTDSLKYIEMRLVDFMYQPVILKSPLFITLKIKPASDI
mgnify:CR=1 FL=1